MFMKLKKNFIYYMLLLKQIKQTGIKNKPIALKVQHVYLFFIVVRRKLFS